LDKESALGQAITITGTFDRQSWRDERSGSTIFTIRTKETCSFRNQYGSVKCVGNIPPYTQGMPLKISGVWIYDHKKELQIQIKNIEEVSTDESVTVAYLTGICSGIGDATARKIVKDVGADIFSFIQKPDAEEILKRCVSNIDATALIRAVRNSIEQREVFEFILSYGGSYPTAVRICEEFGVTALNDLKQNPYRIGLRNGL